ncbi:hypothetical protein HZS_3793 [Henneguya salminicola]|nr:hypothetical protein HZS_3793 [Henneguya salminicola]
MPWFKYQLLHLHLILCVQINLNRVLLNGEYGSSNPQREFNLINRKPGLKKSDHLNSFEDIDWNTTYDVLILNFVNMEFCILLFVNHNRNNN